MKRFIAAILACLTLAGCSQAENPVESYDFSSVTLVQLEEPKDGAKLAVIDTSLGTITAVLYPEYAPNTVNNFIALADEGYYDGLPVAAVSNDIYFLAGAKENEDGKYWKTITGEPIKNEYSPNLWSFKGALLAYNDNLGFGDSRFFICNEMEISEDEMEYINSNKTESGDEVVPQKIFDAYIEKGGVLGFFAAYTVFGQTIDGMDVVEKIVSAKVDEETNKPVEDIIINKITITEYKSDETKQN